MNSQELMADSRAVSPPWARNPFRHPAPPVWGIEYTETTDARDRRAMVAKFTAGQCRAALEHVIGLQLTVRKAVEARLRKLQSQGGTEPHRP